MESSITILSLPKEVSQIIISHIDFFNVLGLCFVNKYFYDILRNKYPLKILSDKIRSSFDIFKKMKTIKHGINIHIAAIALLNNMGELYNSIKTVNPKIKFMIKMHVVYMNEEEPNQDYEKIKGFDFYALGMVDMQLKIQKHSGKTYYEYLNSFIEQRLL